MHPHPRRTTRQAVRAPLAIALAAGLLAPAAASAAPAGCPAAGRPYDAGVNCRTVEVDGYPRRFLVYVPNRGTATGTRPVVFMFHGSSGTGDQFLRISGWREQADATGLIAVFPTGLRYRDLDTGRLTTKWNDGHLDQEVDLGERPPDYPGGAPWPADDVGFTDAMLADVRTQLPVDRHRVYASGFSNGANFAARLGVERSTVLAAVAFSAGALQRPHHAVRPIPTFMLAGSLDDRILARTGPPPLSELPLDASVMSVPAVASTLDTEVDALRLDPNDYGTLQLADGPEIHWPAREDSILRFMVIDGLRHRYPNGGNNPAGFRAAEAFWHFFEANRLP